MHAIRCRMAAVVLLAAAAAAPLWSQSGGRTHAAITASDLRTRLFLLADDSMQGREPGGIGDFKAAEYIASEFRRLGLERAGEGGTFFQDVPFFRIAADTGSRIVAGGTTLTNGRDFLLTGAPGPLRRLDHVPSVYGGPLNDSTHWAPAESIAGRVVVLTLTPGPDGIRSARGPGALARNPRFARAAVIGVASLDLLGPEQIAAVAAGRLMIDTTRMLTAVPFLFLSLPPRRPSWGGPPTGSRRARWARRWMDWWALPRSGCPTPPAMSSPFSGAATRCCGINTSR